MNAKSIDNNLGVTVKLRSDLHISRKIFHTLGVLSICVLFHQLNRQEALALASVACFFVLGLDILRLKVPKIGNTLVGMFRRVMRDNEMNGLTGTSYLIFGVLTVIYIFPRDIANLSLILLAIGDPVCSIFGVLYGKDKIVGNKSLQGSLAGFVACTIVGAIFYYSKGIMLERIVLVSILTGIIGTISELIPVFKLDDNFSFPVLAATMLWFLFHLFGGFA